MEGTAGRVLLFSYGTLQQKSVQLDLFRRELSGRPDSLPGYRLGKIPIADPKFAAASGTTHYANVEPSEGANDSVAGTVFEISAHELSTADGYEAPARYRRIAVALRSGVQAWVYLRPR